MRLCSLAVLFSLLIGCGKPKEDAAPAAEPQAQARPAAKDWTLDMEKAEAAYEAGDYEQARNAVLPAMQAGHAPAVSKLAG